jgi:hypothetical protein
VSQRVEVAVLVLQEGDVDVGRVEDVSLAIAAFQRAGFSVSLLPAGSTVRVRKPSGRWQQFVDKLARI